MKKRIFCGALIAFTGLLMLLSAAACLGKLDDPPELFKPQGHVKTFGTQMPITGARVYQSVCEGELSNSLNCSVVDSAITDVQGHFTLSTPGGLTLAATAAGYFPSETQAILSNGATPADIYLYPHAWLKVQIRNESGAYGFYPDRDQSGLPPIQVEIGKDSTLNDIDLKEGNNITKYIFSVRTIEGGPPPLPGYWTNVRAFIDGTQIPVTVGAGAYVSFYLPGHDTTELTIIY